MVFVSPVILFSAHPLFPVDPQPVLAFTFPLPSVRTLRCTPDTQLILLVLSFMTLL